MARSISVIKQQVTNAFIKNTSIQTMYQLDIKKTFDEQFSKVSLESIIFYVVSVAIWTLETLFDRHKDEITGLINELKPHSLRWYASKAKLFQFGSTLVQDTDEYDNAALSDEQVEERRVVKYAAVVEKAAIIYVKVAGGEPGNRHPLDGEQVSALETYFKEVKDAGVKLNVVNKPADVFNLVADVYYDPQIFDNTLKRLDGGGQTVINAIASFVENLPFNGEYRNSALINTLTALEGVVLFELKRATVNGDSINAKCVPESGYFKIDPGLQINAIAYETVSD